MKNVRYYLSLFLIATSIYSCKFILSPYSAETPNLELNNVNLSKIKDIEVNEGPDFKIAIISDTHNYYKELEKIIDIINADNYSFVIVSGDITNNGLLSEYDESRRFLNKLKVPYLVVVGNHDLISNGDKIFSRMFGPRDFTFQYKDIQFFLINNNNWEAAGEVPDTRWLSEELSNSSSPFKVVIGHVAPDDKDRFTFSMISRWEDLITNSGVDYFINGHNHNPGEGQFGSSTHITVGAPSKKVFLELSFSAGGLTHKKITF